MRLVKFVAHAGAASRRGAEGLIASGRIGVDGRPVTDPAFDVDAAATVTLDGRPLTGETHEYFLLNKPLGVVSTASDPQGRPKVTELVPARGRVYPVGRLDADTTGLILLTNDGELANRLTHPRFEVAKTYRAQLRGRVGHSFAGVLRRGVQLDDGLARADAVRIVERKPRSSVVEITIHEGRKRQVRRMCEAASHPVTRLVRVRFGPLALRRLAPGSWRRLTGAELARLRAASGRRRWQNGRL